MKSEYNPIFHDGLVQAVNNSIKSRFLSPYKLIILNGLVNGLNKNYLIFDQGLRVDNFFRTIAKLSYNYSGRLRAGSTDMGSLSIYNYSNLSDEKFDAIERVYNSKALFQRQRPSISEVRIMQAEMDDLSENMYQMGISEDNLKNLNDWIWCIINNKGIWRPSLCLKKDIISDAKYFVVGTGLKFRNRLMSDYLTDEGATVLRWVHGDDRVFFRDLLYHNFEFESVSGALTQGPLFWQKRFKLDHKNLKVKKLSALQQKSNNFNKNNVLVFGSCLIDDALVQPFGFKRTNKQILDIHRELVGIATEHKRNVHFRPHPKGKYKEQVLDSLPSDVTVVPTQPFKEVLKEYGAFYFEYCGSAWFEIINNKHDDQIVYVKHNNERAIVQQMITELPPNVYFL